MTLLNDARLREGFFKFMLRRMMTHHGILKELGLRSMAMKDFDAKMEEVLPKLHFLFTQEWGKHVCGVMGEYPVPYVNRSECVVAWTLVVLQPFPMCIYMHVCTPGSWCGCVF